MVKSLTMQQKRNELNSRVVEILPKLKSLEENINVTNQNAKERTFKKRTLNKVVTQKKVV